MRFSEISVGDVAEYLREDTQEPLLWPVLLAARRYVLDYTGLTEEEADAHEDLSIAVLAVCADLYDRRTTAITSTTVSENPLLAQILGAHSTNLL